MRFAILLVMAMAAGAGEPDRKATKEPPLAETPIVADLQGIYRVRSQDADGSIYHGAATLTRKGEATVFHCIVEGGTIEGIGMRHGEVLSVAWWTAGKTKGVTLYDVRQDKEGLKLVGRWVGAPGD